MSRITVAESWNINFIVYPERGIGFVPHQFYTQPIVNPPLPICGMYFSVGITNQSKDLANVINSQRMRRRVKVVILCVCLSISYQANYIPHL